MAIKKKIISRAGFEMGYWKITDWRPVMAHNLFEITLTPYVSSQTRADGLEPVHEEIRKIRVYDDINKIHPDKSTFDYTNSFSPQALENSNMSIYELMYKYIKENVPEFQDYEDILEEGQTIKTEVQK